MPCKDPEKRKAYREAYYQKNRDHLITQQKAYYQLHKEHTIAQKKEYRETNREVILAKSKAKWKQKASQYAEQKRMKYRYNKDLVWASNIKQRFGITPNDYYEMLEKQGGVCATCGGQCKTGRRLAVDHDHITGKVRGLLCSSCNIVVGHLQDSPERIQRISDYLKQHSQLRLVRNSA